ncbi:hypothetical protein CRG98_010547 [Punica granatum]|uniref:Isopenicillin N synthase-like Fe(2+) 2OG dioxygenase domain-containing protein n=1 Tax=Punica granatum TaxID=22663 RepID=A0A2I0KKN2_PUNGR|nr:hypothetical protein CRG98_010547 [Punica granatum]
MRMTYHLLGPQPEQVFGLSPHYDATAIMILHQMNGTDGLHIKRNCAQLPVNILPHAFVVNVGPMISSNGISHSIEPWAMGTLRRKGSAVPMFFNPKLEAGFGPAASFVNPEIPDLFRRITMGEYVKGFFSQSMDGSRI